METTAHTVATVQQLLVYSLIVGSDCSQVTPLLPNLESLYAKNLPNWVFAEDIYGDHVVSCAGIVGINIGITLCAIPLLTFVFGAGFQLEKKLILGLVEGGTNHYVMLLYSWDNGLDVCVDLTGSSPLTQTVMVDFMPGRAVIEAAQRKRVKYEAKCIDIGYSFLSFSFSSLGELEKDAVTLLKRIRKFSLTQDIGVQSTFSLSPRQMALWTSQMEDYTSDWLRTVPISGLVQLVQGFFAGDIYGDHVVSCAGIIGIKHRHNVVRDTLVDICYRSGISAGKEVDIGLDGGRDKPLRPADMLLYSWDGGLDVCVDLTGSSPLTQTGMVDFVPGRAVIDAAQRKREADAVTLLKRIRKFSMAQDIGARAAVHIFNRISFAIAKGVGPR
ncbi:hypothetical protein Tco_0658892 [Tanacetum coccineum]